MGRKQWRYTPHVAFGLFMLVVVLTWRFTMHIIEAPPSAQSEKLHRASKMISYRVDRTHAAHFRLSGRDNTIRLITHAIIPAGAPLPLSPADEPVAYGVRLVARRAGADLWSHDIWSTSRQTKQPLGESLVGEGAFVADGSLQLTDGRYTTLALPAMPLDAELWVYSVDDTAVLIRLLERQTRTAAQIARSETLLDDAVGSELTDGRFLGTWAMLDPDERHELLQYRWSKLSALGERDLDYAAVSHYVMELPVIAAAKRQSWMVSDTHWLAATSYGPCAMTLTTEDGVGLMVRVVGESGVGAWQPYTAPLALPAGFQSVWVRTVASGSEAEVGVAGCEVFQNNGATARGGVALRRTGATAVGPAQPVAFAVGTAEIDRTMRLEVRRLEAEAIVDAEGAPLPPSLRIGVTFADARGHVMGHDETVLTLPRQYFDYASEAGEPTELAEPSGSAAGDDLRPSASSRRRRPWRALSEPASLRVIAPVGAVRVEISADAPALVRALRYTGQVSQIASAFVLGKNAEPVVRWRGAPFDVRSWIGIEPAEPSAPGAQYAIYTPQRLQPLGVIDPLADAVISPAAADAAELFAVAPNEPLTNHALLEASLADPRSPKASPWHDLDEAEIAPDQQVVATLPMDAVRPLVLRCLAPAAPVTLMAKVGGATYEKTQMVPRDTWELPTQATGDVAVAWSAAGAAVRCFLNRQVKGGGPAQGTYRVRTLYMWEPGATISTTVRHGGETSVYAVIYDTTSQASRQPLGVEAALRGGARQRLTGKLVERISMLARAVEAVTFAPRGEGLWLDTSVAVPAQGAVVRFGMGADIRPGPQTVTWRHLGRHPVWVRFVANVSPPKASSPSLRRIELVGGDAD